jgi:hypothetical protein
MNILKCIHGHIAHSKFWQVKDIYQNLFEKLFFSAFNGFVFNVLYIEQQIYQFDLTFFVFLNIIK